MSSRQRIASYAAAVVAALALTAAPGIAPPTALAAEDPPVDLAVTVSASDTLVSPGQEVVFTTLVENKLSGGAKPVRVRMNTTAGLTDVRVTSAPGFTCTREAPFVTCRGGRIPGNQDVSIVITATAPPRGASRLRAVADPEHRLNDPNIQNNSDEVTILVRD